MNIFRIENLAEFLKHIPRSDNIESEVVFRGQCEDWPLIPSLFRENHACFEHGGKWDSYEQVIWRLFSKKAHPYLRKEPESITEWLTLAQHHGVPTRMLDWTRNPLVALYFAVENTSIKGDAIVWCFVARNIRMLPFENYSELNGLTKTCLYRPNHIDSRMTAQDAYLTIHPLPEEDTEFTPFNNDVCNWSRSRFEIAFEFKEELKHQLDDAGINGHSIYPDLDGLAVEIHQRIKRLKTKGEQGKKRTSFRQQII